MKKLAALALVAIGLFGSCISLRANEGDPAVIPSLVFVGLMVVGLLWTWRVERQEAAPKETRARDQTG